MILESYSSRRQRRRFSWAMVKWGLALAVILAAAWYAYHVGDLVAQRESVKLAADLEAATTRLTDAEGENARLHGLLAASRREIDDLKQRYAQDVPQGIKARALQMIEKRLNDDLPLERLFFVINNARNHSDCAVETVSRRLVVKTPLYNGANDVVSFDQNRLTLRIEGAPAVNSNGAREAWFDAAQPIRVSITHISGQSAEIEGILPIQQALVVGAQEHRLQLVNGERSFVQATHQLCDFP